MGIERRVAVLVVFAGVVTAVGAALLLGGGGPAAPDTTPEPTPTAEPPDTTTPTETTTAPETTTETPEPTTTKDPQPSFTVDTEPLPETMYTREIDVAISVTNSGPSGVYSAELRVDRHHGDRYDATRQLSGEVGANAVRWFNFTIEVGATGTYTVTLDDRDLGTVDVRAWSSGPDDDGTSTTAEPTTTETPEETVIYPTANVTVQVGSGGS